MTYAATERKRGRPRKREAAQKAAAAIARGEYFSVSEAAHAFVVEHAPRLQHQTSDERREDAMFHNFRDYIIEELKNAKGGMNGFRILANVSANSRVQPVGRNIRERKITEILISELRSSSSFLLEIERAWKNSSVYIIKKNIFNLKGWL